MASVVQFQDTGKKFSLLPKTPFKAQRQDYYITYWLCYYHKRRGLLTGSLKGVKITRYDKWKCLYTFFVEKIVTLCVGLVGEEFSD